MGWLIRDRSLRGFSAFGAYPVLSIGMGTLNAPNYDVRTAQQKLNSPMGYLMPYQITGVFDESTRIAVVKLQGAYNIRELGGHGVIGELTWHVLLSPLHGSQAAEDQLKGELAIMQLKQDQSQGIGTVGSGANILRGGASDSSGGTYVYGIEGQRTAAQVETSIADARAQAKADAAAAASKAAQAAAAAQAAYNAANEAAQAAAAQANADSQAKAYAEGLAAEAAREKAEKATAIARAEAEKAAAAEKSRAVALALAREAEQKKQLMWVGGGLLALFVGWKFLK